MNSNDTIKAIAPIVNSFLRNGITVERAMDLFGQTLLESSTASPKTNGRDIKTGFRVTDPEGGTHEYPDAFDAFPNRLDLILTDEGGKTIAIFHRWENVERIA